MIKYFLFPFIIFSTISVRSQTSLIWAKSFGAALHDMAKSVTVDAAGNVYLAGFYYDLMDADPNVGYSYLNGNGENDVFVIKLDASGKLVWAKSLGSTANDEAQSISVDSRGNVYTIGFFEGTVDFDPGAGTHLLSSAGEKDIFIIKLNASGNFVWAQCIGGVSRDEGHAITTDASGNIFATGHFSKTVDFEAGPGVTNLATDGANYNTDIFFTCMDSTGTLVWAKQLGSYVSDNGSSIALDDSGNVYTCGYYSYGAFFSRHDRDGNLKWSRMMFGSLTVGSAGFAIAVDAYHNIYATGYFQGNFRIDTGSATADITSAGESDIFVVKFSNTGKLDWLKSVGGSSHEQGFDIITSGRNIYLTGFFGGSADFDPGIKTYNLNSAGQNDLFISKWDSLGNLKWVQQAGGVASDVGYALCSDKDENLYAAGFFSASVDFDPGTGSAIMNSEGMADIFILKLKPVDLGIKTAGNVPQFVFYPNPAGDRVNLQLSDATQGNCVWQVQVINGLGQILAIKVVSVNTINEIDLSGLPVGIYVIRLLSDEMPVASSVISKL